MKNPKNLLPPSKKPYPAGFALIVTLSLMILLTVIAVGLLTLSSISLRTNNRSVAASLARENARLGLLLALGELQASLGPDQSVSAPASAVFRSAAQPHLTGAWQRSASPAKSGAWHWSPTAGGSPSYSEKAGLFRGWLVSSADPATTKSFDFAKAASPAGTGSVPLVGSTATPLENAGVVTTVTASKIKVGTTSQAGNLAWAVFDESTKASIDLGDPSIKQSDKMEIASRAVPHRMRADALDSKLSSLKDPVNLISLETATISAGVGNRSEFRKRFHDFTTHSVGLLTDTVTGGLKTDLTALFEPTTLPAGAFTPAGGGATASSPYPAALADAASTGAPKWAYLRDHYRKYKAVRDSGTGELTYPLGTDTDLKVSFNGASTGVVPSPDTERLLPVIAKFQLIFSLVAHLPFNVDNRRAILDSSGDPRGYTNYGAVNLAYDPVITLYNPYDVSLDLSRTRIRVWDPPVGFSFRKIDNRTGATANFRADNAYQGLAGLHYNAPANARKCFTLVLADGTSQQLGTTLKLKPGEVRVFSPRVERTWNWGVETAGGYGSNSEATFFDWDPTKNFGNQDHRSSARFQSLGVECAPGFDVRAGLQTDNLANNRNPASKYSFEPNGAFVTLRKTDEVAVDAKPMVVSAGAATQFQVDVLAGNTVGNSSHDISADSTNTGVAADTLRSYRFNFSNVSDEISADPAHPVITRQFLVEKILQPDTGAQTGFKKPFAMLEMSARTTKEELTDSKPWLYNNFVVEGAKHDSAVVGLTHQSYDLRLIEISSFNNFPDGVAIDPDTYRGYFGANGSIEEGSSFVPMMHVPVAPTASLGDLIPTNLVSGALLPRVVHPFGNSRAHPLIPSGKIAQSRGTLLLDHSYLLNDALWDSCYFSTLAAYVAGSASGNGLTPGNRSLEDVVTGVIQGSQPAINNRLIPVANACNAPAQAREIAGLSDLDRSRKLAKYLAVNGAFNVNSTSVDAWQAVLLSLRDREINGVLMTETGSGSTRSTSVGERKYPNDGRTPFVRTGRPLTGSTPAPALKWAGFKALDDAQIRGLANAIVAQIKLRGVKDSAPFFSLGEFVNRRPGAANGLHCLAGLIQTAVDTSGINQSAENDSKILNEGMIHARRKTGTEPPEVMNGLSAEGAPTLLTQGDVMAAIASVATVRGDTFKIRSYGEAMSADGKTVIARAWCEAVVQRVPEFVDPTDTADTAVNDLKSVPNQNFGRRFNIVSFRWMKDTEV